MHSSDERQAADPGRRKLLIGSAALTGAALAAPVRAALAPPVVTMRAGRVRGTIESGIHVFRGLRYGADTRPRRFQAPVAPDPWSDIAEATAFAPSCPQRPGRYASVSEDCLFLNVWTPGPDRRAKRPVMLYIHGGAYASGSVVDPLNYGHHLAAHGDVVVVTVNHRLNAFGYCYLSRLSHRFPDSGNVGQLDLILALRWVRDNIAEFGGDPSRVMLFGQSGGGAKIATLMAMPAAEGLFHSAATMSGQQVTVSGPHNALARTRAYLARLKVEHPDQLLDLTTEQLVEGLHAPDPYIEGGVYFGPVLDERNILRHPFWPDAHPLGLKIPLILGNTLNERGATNSSDPKLKGLSWDNIAERIDLAVVDILPDKVVAAYRGLFPKATPAEIYLAINTDGRAWRGQVEEAEARARSTAPAWVYQLNFPSPLFPERGAVHTFDIPLAFGTLDAPGSITGTGPAAQRVSRAMMDAFVSLARTGDPNHAGLSHWPRYLLDKRATMIFDDGPRVENDPRRVQRELFAKVPFTQAGT